MSLGGTPKETGFTAPCHGERVVEVARAAVPPHGSTPTEVIFMAGIQHINHQQSVFY